MGLGCQAIHSAKDADAQNLFTLLKNCQRFSTCGQIGRMDLVGELLEIRNSLCHSGDHRVLEAKLQKDMQTMLEFLTGVTPQSPVQRQAVADAVSKITELQNNKVDLSLATNKDLELGALQQKQNALDLKQNALDLMQQELKQETDDSIRSFQTEQQKQKTETNAAVTALQKEQQEMKRENRETDAIVKTLQTEQHKMNIETKAAFKTLQKEQREMLKKTDAAFKTLKTEQQERKRETGGTVKTLQTEQQEMKRETDAEFKILHTEQQEMKTEQQEMKRETDAEFKILYTEQQELKTEQQEMKRETDAEFKILQTDQQKLKTETNASVKSLQTEQQMLKTKTTAAVKTLSDKITDCEAQMKQVQSDQDQFKRFLQANNLEQNLFRLYSCVEQHERRITNLEQQVQRIPESQREVNEDDIIRLQHKLIKHYQDGQSLLVPNPVVDEALDLEEIYVRPDIKVLREISNPRAGLKVLKENKKPDDLWLFLKTLYNSSPSGSTSMCKKLFYTDHYQNKQIYVAGNAGVGKTVLCKYLVNLWCQSRSDSQSRSTLMQRQEQNQVASQLVDISDTPDISNLALTMEQKIEARLQARIQAEMKKQKEEENKDRRIMAEFPLVFYISLRQSSKLYTVADMIDSQILKQIRGLSHLRAADILQNSRCLVMVDGLDEWTCPEDAGIPPFINRGIPGRDLNSNSVFLTTTRPWKLDVLGLKGLEIDKHVELCGLNETSSRLLCSKYIDFVNKLDGTNKQTQTFSTELQKKGLERFHNVPNLLILLIGLWMDNQDLGQSRLQLFCSMLELLLKRAAEKNLLQQRSNDSDSTDRLLPECFNNHPHCLMHQHLLAHLCKVAFEALLDPKQEEALVFNTSQLMICGINSEDISLCLKSGILTQDKVLGKRSVKEKKISFLHKQLQEVLAAVYISNRGNAQHVTSRIHDFCTTVESVLELSKVWMFSSGINPDLTRELLKDLMTQVVLNDDKLKQYRYKMHSALGNLRASRHDTGLPKFIQRCIVDCVMEARSNGHGDLCLPLYDVIVDYKYTISPCLEYLVTANKSVIKSVYICTSGIKINNEEKLVCILTQLQHTSCVQALLLDHYRHVIPDESLLPKLLVNNKDTLTNLGLCGITLPTELYAAVCDFLHYLTSLSLRKYGLTHKQIEQLLLSVSKADGMRDLHLSFYLCPDFVYNRIPVLGLSGHTQLHRLILNIICVVKLPVVALCMKEVRLCLITISESQLRQFIQQLSFSPHSVEVDLDIVKVTGESESPVDLTDPRHNKQLHVTRCVHYDSNNTWSIEFFTLQQENREICN